MSKIEEQVYATPESELQDENTAENNITNLADRGTRLGAVILDSLIVVLMAIAPGVALMFFLGGDFALEDEEAMTINVYLYSSPFIIILLLIQGTLLYKYGQTIGKRLLKIKIVRSDNTRVAFGRLLGLRIILMQVLFQIPILGGIFSLVNALFIFREDRKCIHDLIADTKVIDVEYDIQE